MRLPLEPLTPRLRIALLIALPALVMSDLVRWMTPDTRVPLAAPAAARTAPPNGGLPNGDLTTDVLRTDALPDLTRWTERTFEDAVTRASFMPDVRHDVAMLRRRLEMVRELSRRALDAETGELPAADRDRLQRQLDLQYRALIDDISRLSPRTSVLFGAAAMSGGAVPHAPANWQNRTTAALRNAVVLDDLLQILRTQQDITPAQQREGIEAMAQLVNAFHPSPSLVP